MNEEKRRSELNALLDDLSHWEAARDHQQGTLVIYFDQPAETAGTTDAPHVTLGPEDARTVAAVLHRHENDIETARELSDTEEGDVERALDGLRSTFRDLVEALPHGTNRLVTLNALRRWESR